MKNFYIVQVEQRWRWNFFAIVRDLHLRYFCALPGFIVAVAASSDAFQNDILAPLKSSYLYKESEHRFQYNSAVLIKNPTQEKRVSLKSRSSCPQIKYST